jgi:hypothetical protein
MLRETHRDQATAVVEAVDRLLGRSLLGTLTAAPDRRHLLFVGGGSFHVTAHELSTILRPDHKPVIFLINNGGYTIERGYLGKTEAYNDIADWAYADLPKVFRRDTSARSFVVRTSRDLQNALRAPNDTMIFVDSIHGPLRRSRRGHQQQQQGGRLRLRASRPATPRQPAAPACLIVLLHYMSPQVARRGSADRRPGGSAY